MEVQPPQFTGSPCGHHGTYTFYRGFRYTKNGISKDLSLGEFFFVRISADVDPCIGELQLLCSNRNNEQQLSALRLYFLPEQTPEGRLSHHGEDEVLVASDRIVLKLEDLVTWITEEVEWNHGILAPVSKPAKVEDASPPIKEEKKEGQEETNSKEEEENKKDQLNEKEENKKDELNEKEENKKDELNEKEENKKDQVNEKEDTKSTEIKEEPCQDNTISIGTKVVILSYQKYCRFRSIMKRLDGEALEQWLQDPTVIALGGFTASDKNTRVLFCRDNFEHDELAHHELNCEYLAPTIKGKRRKRKAKTVRSTSPDSNSSVESKLIDLKNNKKTNGLKQPPIKNEEEFLERLYNFMKQRNTPIHRVPHLGFKQIDLFIFYSFAQKLGGYDKITDKRLWKHVYDELGGNPGSTSAATCTRRHYEKLLLPFERFMDGIIYKPTTRGKKSLKRKLEKENAENTDDTTTPVKTEPVAAGTNAETNEADAYNFTDSNHENSNSKDSNSNEFNSVGDEQTATNEAMYSDEDSKTVWSIQKQPDNKIEVDKEDTKAIKPLIIQKGQSETFAEKERKWDEIRRKNAAARKWVRQSRSSSKGCKTPVPEVSHFNGEKPATLESDIPDVNKSPHSVKIKTEPNECQPPQNVPITSNHNQLSQDKVNPSAPSVNHTVSKLPTVHSETIQNVINKLENQKKHMARGKEAPASISCDKKSSYVKSEPIDIPSKSWSGYPVNSEHSSFQSSTYSSVESNIPAHIKNQIPPSHKSASRSESDYPMLVTGRQSVGSMSASSAVSGDTSLNEENKPLLSQRRPSVIQHTEYAATTPSPTLSPKQGSSDVFNMYPKDVVQQCVQFTNPKVNLPPNQMSYSMNGKVAEWLTKGVHEVVACKTPSSVEKTVELHDKVMMPSSCKTPGIVGTGKIPSSNVKNKHSAKGCAKPRSKYAASHQRNSDGNSLTNGNYALSRSEMRNNAMYQKTFHPNPTSYNSVMNNPVSAAKYQQTANPKPEFYPNNPYFNQQKRFKCSNTPPVLSGVGTRPPSLPYVRQQTYRAAPLSDIPKTTTTHNDYDSIVLDLSVKKKPAQTTASRTVNPPPVCTSPVPEGVCLDLSIKKKPNISNDNGIENITPPLPLSPNPTPAPAPYLSSTLKPLPTLISIQDFQSAAMESTRHNYSSSSNRHSQVMNSPASSSATGPSLVMPQTNAMYPASTHSKLPQSIVNTMPVAYSKEIAKNLYMPSTTRHSQFSPYVIPPFFPSSWTSVVNANVNNPKQTNNSQTSPMAYKGMVNHSVFPKDYPSQYKSQFHPVLCKDNGHYPSNAK